MPILKNVLFLALFLLFITLIALADHSNAADGTRTHIQGDTPYYPQAYLRDAYAPAISSWDYYAWSPARYGVKGSNDAHSRAVIERFEQNGLITGRSMDKNGMPVVEVGQLFLRLSDTDKRRVILALAYNWDADSLASPPTFAIKNKESDQFIGLFTYHGLQLQ